MSEDRLQKIERNQETILRNQERLSSLLHKVLGNIPEKQEEWVNYEEACKILNKSKCWYKKARNGEHYKTNPGMPAYLIYGEDWRMIGNEVEYKRSSIVLLKEKLIQRKLKVA